MYLYLFHNSLFQVFGKVHLDTFAGTLDGYLLHVVLDHDAYEFFKRCLGRIPSEFLFGLGGVSPKVDHIGRTIEILAYLDKHTTGSLVDTYFVFSFTLEFKFNAGMFESQITEFAHRVLFARSNDEIFGFLLLEDEPHTFYIVFSISPVAERREVAEIAIAGRISREKNLLTFMDAVAELKRRGVAVHFSWYGNVGGGQEEYSREVAERYEELAIEDYLTFHRGTDKIVEVYQGCDAFCLPSLYEGFPNVVCEAMSCARPVLCSRVCDNPLIVEEGESGYLFNPESATDMADTVERFVGLPTEERRRMGERGRQLAEERFSEESFVEAYIELIK